MAKFSVTITDSAKLAGITAAREAYNATAPNNEDGSPGDPITTDADYVQFVMDRAAASYASQYGTS